MSEYELTYPTPDDESSGGQSVAYSKENSDMFKILTWWNYSPKTGEFTAIESTWLFVEREDGTVNLHLEETAIKYPRVSWFKDAHTPDKSLSDMHLRLAREQFRIRSKKKRCDNLVLSPSATYEVKESEDRP